MAKAKAAQPPANKPPVNVGGRPKKLAADKATLGVIEGLGAIHATQTEAASVLRVHKDTFNDFLRDEPVAREAWERGRDVGKVSLRRSNFELAKKNAVMAMFLSMQEDILGMKDMRRPSVQAPATAPASNGRKFTLHIFENGAAREPLKVIEGSTNKVTDAA